MARVQKQLSQNRDFLGVFKVRAALAAVVMGLTMHEHKMILRLAFK